MLILITNQQLTEGILVFTVNILGEGQDDGQTDVWYLASTWDGDAIGLIYIPKLADKWFDYMYSIRIELLPEEPIPCFSDRLNETMRETYQAFGFPTLPLEHAACDERRGTFSNRGIVDFVYRYARVEW